MKYVYINKSDGNKVGAIVDAIDSKFPGIPIEDRFSPEFLGNCVQVSKDTKIHSGMIYDFETGEFSEPEYESEELRGESQEGTEEDYKGVEE